MTAVRCLHCDAAMEHADEGELRRSIAVHYEVKCRRGIALAPIRSAPKP